VNAWVIAAKDLKVLSRDRVALFWVFVFPLVFALFFGSVLEDVELTPGAGAGLPSGFVRSLPAAILWGLMACTATFAVGLVSERTRGTLHRLRASPLSNASLLTGKALACFAASLLEASLLIAIAAIAFDASIDHLLMLVVAVLSTAGGFVGITLLLGALGKSEQAVSGAGWAAMLALAMLGGAMVPAQFMPEWLRGAGELSPVRWGLDALETALWKGGGARALAAPCAALLAVGGAGIALAALALERVARR
jgi:ABC-2 type transport system permease protein